MEGIDQIEGQIKAGLASKLGLKSKDVVNNARLVEDLGLDSLDTFDLLFDLEKEYGVEIPSVDALGFVTVGDVVAYVQKRIGATPAEGAA